MPKSPGSMELEEHLLFFLIRDPSKNQRNLIQCLQMLETRESSDSILNYQSSSNDQISREMAIKALG